MLSLTKTKHHKPVNIGKCNLLKSEPDGLDITCTLTMGNDGKISNTNADFETNQSGYSVKTHSSFTDPKSYKIVDSLGNVVGALWGTDSEMFLDGFDNDVTMQSIGGIVKMTGANNFIQVIDGGDIDIETSLGALNIAGKTNVDVRNADEFMEVVGGLGSFGRILQIRKSDSSTNAVAALRLLCSPGDSLGDYVELRAVRTNDPTSGAHGFSVRVSPGSGGYFGHTVPLVSDHIVPLSMSDISG